MQLMLMCAHLQLFIANVLFLFNFSRGFYDESHKGKKINEIYVRKG